MNYFYEEYRYGTSNSYDAFSEENPDFRYHFHRCYEIISVIDGQIKVQVNEKEHLLSAGDTILIFPDQLHSFQTPSYANVVFLIFSPELISDFTNEFAAFEPDSAVIKNHPLPLSLAATTNLYEQKALLYQICGILSERPRQRKALLHSNQLTLLHTILTYLQQHYQSGCSLRELSKQTGYDYTYLSKYFEKKMGLTFTAFLNQLRIQQACTLLKNTNDAISDIAFSCGYETIRTFNRNFIAIMNLTPSEYREQLLFPLSTGKSHQ